jgi:hypothetical protein
MPRTLKKKPFPLFRADDIEIQDFFLKQYFLTYDNIASIEKKLKQSQNKIVDRFNDELIKYFPKLQAEEEIIKPYGYTFSYPEKKFYSLNIMLQDNDESLFFEGTENIRYKYNKGFYDQIKGSIKFGLETGINRYEELFIINNKYSNNDEKIEIKNYLEWTKPDIIILNYKK